MDRVEAIVIGAGVVGLAIARALALTGREVLLLEAEDRFGLGTSSRNSGVIHAGIYYPTNSLKAKCCIEGKARLYDYARLHGIDHDPVGKFIVATNERQIETLSFYKRQGEANGIDDLEIVDTTALKAREPEAKGIAALWSPSTGIIDVHGLMLSLLGAFEAAGGMLVFKAPVTQIDAGDGAHVVHVGGEASMSLEAKLVVNAAGHGAPGLGRAEGAPVAHFAAGHYFSYAGASPFSHLIYPVAEDGGLGVHGTLDLGGQLRFGPDVQWRDSLDFSFDGSRKAHFAVRIRDYFPGLEEDRLHPDFVGVRPKIVGPGDEGADFVVAGPEMHGVDGLVHLYGIESPGLTSCLALAEEVLTRL